MRYEDVPLNTPQGLLAEFEHACELLNLSPEETERCREDLIELLKSDIDLDRGRAEMDIEEVVWLWKKGV